MASIRQNLESEALPDFRNLGVLARVLIGVNLAALAGAFYATKGWNEALDHFVQAATFVEPLLIACLTILFILAPWLRRLPYAAGALLVLAIVLGCAAGLLALEAVPKLMQESGRSLPRTLAFSAAMVLLLLGYFRLFVRAYSPALTEARLQALQARIRPHFLFNSLNAVLSLLRRDPERAEEALHDMADLFRVLMRDNRELAPLSDEVDLCRAYLDLEKLRLGDRLVVDWNVKSMPADALVPPLVLQPICENAVYHGIEPSSQPGTISVNIFLSKGEVHAVLRNPYRATGGNHHSGNKMALDNVRERLALHFDAEASLESRVLEHAYEVHIRMPYRTETRGAVPGPAMRAVPPAPPAPVAKPKPRASDEPRHGHHPKFRTGAAHG